MRHRAFPDLPAGTGCQGPAKKISCMKSKLRRVFYPKYLESILNRVLWRYLGMQHFLASNSLPHLSVSYEDLTAPNNVIRTNAWCSIEKYLKKRFSQSSCAKTYLGEFIHSANLTWCIPFAANFRPTPLRNHSEIILNTNEVISSISSNISAKFWRGPKYTNGR